MNTLTGLIPTMLKGLDTVAREQVGFIPSCSINSDGAEQAAVGQIITIPQTQGVASSTAISPSNVAPNTGGQTIDPLTMTITKAQQVPILWTGEEMLSQRNTGQINKIMADQFAQAVRTLCNEVELDLAVAAKIGASRAYGIPGTAPFASDVSDTAQIRKILEDNGCPMSDCHYVMNTTAGANLRTLYQLTKANEAGTDGTLRQGVLLDLHGFALRTSNQNKVHTIGTANGAYLTNTAGGNPVPVGTTTIPVDTGAGTIVAGDTVAFAGDPNIYVVATDLAAGSFTINKPGLVQALADGVAVTVNAAYTPSIAFHRNSLQLIARAPAMPVDPSTGKPLDMADDMTTVTDPISGLSFQVVVYRQFRQVQYQVCLAWGVKAIKPEFMALNFG
jgi:hypothetical protein